MRHRLTGAILLLYPCRVREGHGPEIVALIDDLIAHEGRSRTGLFIRLAVDGLVQRIASTATVWTVSAVLAATSFGGLAVSDFAAADAPQVAPRTVHTSSAASCAKWAFWLLISRDWRWSWARSRATSRCSRLRVALDAIVVARTPALSAVPPAETGAALAPSPRWRARSSANGSSASAGPPWPAAPRRYKTAHPSGEETRMT
jgi:hypothetical protein